MQTSDPQNYVKMLKHTSATVFEYCERWNCRYLCYVGIERGGRNWHAALNRIIMINDLIDKKYKGWILYLDADAYINEIDFNIFTYLQNKSTFAFIAAPSGCQPPHWWDINNGVFALNIGSDFGIEIARKWHVKLQSIDEEKLKKEAKWGQVVDDQHILHAVFQENLHLEAYVHHDGSVFNGQARFVRQIMRSAADFETRVEKLSRVVSTTLARSNNIFDNQDKFFHDFIRALYKVFFGREPDPKGFESSLSGLKSGRRTIIEELKACVSSREFQNNIERLKVKNDLGS